jgi:hypothetical protein
MAPLPKSLRALLGPIAGGISLCVFGIVGITWLSIAATTAAVATLGPVWGPAAVGAGMLAPPGVFGLVVWAKSRRTAAAPLQSVEGVDASLAAIAAAAHKMIEKSPIAALAVATLAGLLSTRYPAGLSLLAHVLGANDRTEQT